MSQFLSVSYLLFSLFKMDAFQHEFAGMANNGFCSSGRAVGFHFLSIYLFILSFLVLLFAKLALNLSVYDR